MYNRKNPNPFFPRVSSSTRPRDHRQRRHCDRRAQAHTRWKKEKRKKKKHPCATQLPLELECEKFERTKMHEQRIVYFERRQSLRISVQHLTLVYIPKTNQPTNNTPRGNSTPPPLFNPCTHTHRIAYVIRSRQAHQFPSGTL